MQKRPFKSNLLIRFFGKNGLPKNWQRVLKGIGTSTNEDPKNFYGWNEYLQLAAVFFSILDVEKFPSKKNIFRLGKEVSENKEMINKAKFLKSSEKKILIDKLNRPKIVSFLLNLKEDVTADIANNVKYIKFIEDYGINVLNSESFEIVKAMIANVKKDEYSYYMNHFQSLEDIYSKRFNFISPVKNLTKKVGHITYTVEKTADCLFLDAASDCCQGIGKFGEECLRFGFRFKNSAFITFRRRGDIFAQSWIIVQDDTIILDSIETKGEMTESLGIAVNDLIQELKKHYKYIVLGLTPNTNGQQLLKVLSFKSKEKNLVKEQMKKFQTQGKAVFRSDFYTDTDRGFIVL